MAVALTVEAAALHVVGEPLAKLTPGDRAAIEAITATAALLVARYAAGSDIPAAVCNAAALRMAYFDYWTRMPVKVAVETLAIPGRRGSLNPLRSSGAMALLSPWKRRRAGIASGEAPAARERRIEVVEARLAALETAPAGVTEAAVQSAIAAALAGLPQPAPPGLTAAEVDGRIAAAIGAIPEPAPGVTLEQVQATVTAAVGALAGRAVELLQVLTWTATNAQSGHNIRSTGIDTPAGPLLVVGRLGSYTGASYLPAADVSAIPRNDTALATTAATLVLPLGHNRGLYLAKSRIGRLKVGATHDGRPAVSMYRLVLGAADA